MSIKERLANAMRSNKDRFSSLEQWNSDNVSFYLENMVDSGLGISDIYDIVKRELFVKSKYHSFHYFNQVVFNRVANRCTRSDFDMRVFCRLMDLLDVTDEEIGTLIVDISMCVRMDCLNRVVKIKDNFLVVLFEFINYSMSVSRIIKYILIYKSKLSDVDYEFLLDELTLKISSCEIELDINMDLCSLLLSVLSERVVSSYVLNELLFSGETEVSCIILLAVKQSIVEVREDEECCGRTLQENRGDLY